MLAPQQLGAPFLTPETTQPAARHFIAITLVFLSMPSCAIFLTGNRTILDSSLAASQHDDLAAKDGFRLGAVHGSLRRSPGLANFHPLPS